jgi:hypothetical protein
MFSRYGQKLGGQRLIEIVELGLKQTPEIEVVRRKIDGFIQDLLQRIVGDVQTEDRFLSHFRLGARSAIDFGQR